MTTTLHLSSTLFMTGLIWWVQVVHYPLFASVGEDAFPAYHRRHMRWSGWVVGPPMLLELGTGLALLQAEPDNILLWVGLLLLAIIWISTALLQVPCHQRLAQGFRSEVHSRLVRTNWVRTAAWTARSILLLNLITGP